MDFSSRSAKSANHTCTDLFSPLENFDSNETNFPEKTILLWTPWWAEPNGDWNFGEGTQAIECLSFPVKFFYIGAVQQKNLPSY